MRRQAGFVTPGQPNVAHLAIHNVGPLLKALSGPKLNQDSARAFRMLSAFTDLDHRISLLWSLLRRSGASSAPVNLLLTASLCPADLVSAQLPILCRNGSNIDLAYVCVLPGNDSSLFLRPVLRLAIAKGEQTHDGSFAGQNRYTKIDPRRLLSSIQYPSVRILITELKRPPSRGSSEADRLLESYRTDIVSHAVDLLPRILKAHAALDPAASLLELLRSRPSLEVCSLIDFLLFA